MPLYFALFYLIIIPFSSKFYECCLNQKQIEHFTRVGIYPSRNSVPLLIQYMSSKNKLTSSPKKLYFW